MYTPVHEFMQALTIKMAAMFANMLDKLTQVMWSKPIFDTGHKNLAEE
jgi:hypothetical protein